MKSIHFQVFCVCTINEKPEKVYINVCQSDKIGKIQEYKEENGVRVHVPLSLSVERKGEQGEHVRVHSFISF